MKRKAIFYHDGCATCLSIAKTVVALVDVTVFDLEIVNLGRVATRADEAQAAGVRVLPSLVVDGFVMPIDPHSDLDHVRPERRAATKAAADPV